MERDNVKKLILLHVPDYHENFLGKVPKILDQIMLLI